MNLKEKKTTSAKLHIINLQSEKHFVMEKERNHSIGSWCSCCAALRQCRGSSARDVYKWICVESSIVFLVVLMNIRSEFNKR